MDEQIEVAPKKKKGWRWWQITLAIFFGLFVLGSILPKPKEGPQAAGSNVGSEKDGDASPSASEGASAAASKWSYGNSTDEMRGTETRTATLTSENEINLDFPYGEQSGELTIRHDPKAGLNIMLSVKEGQILCRSFAESHLNVKFDDGPIQKFECTDASDGSSNVAFVTSEASFLKKLRSAKRTVIEAEFFQNGNQQFVFQTAGLTWK